MEQTGSGDLWQAQAVADLSDLLERDSSVQTVFLIGTGVSRPEMDVFSDVDLVVVLDDSALSRFTGNVDWLASFGRVYAYAIWEAGEFPTLRVYFDDGRRVDFLFVGLQQVDQFMAWPKNPLRFGAETLFSRAPLPKTPSRWPELPPAGCPSRDTIQAMANDFRFKCMLAVSKVARDDLLVATHLCLELLTDCVVLALLVRDKETGSDHHRGGEGHNNLIDGLPVLSRFTDAEAILTTVIRALQFFDRQAAVLDTHYRPHPEPLLEWLAFARRHRAM